MSHAIITVEGVGKRYRLGAHTNERYTALRDVIASKARSLFRNALRGPAQTLTSQGHVAPLPAGSIPQSALRDSFDV